MKHEFTTVRVFTAFSGYDSQLLALNRLSMSYPWIKFKCIGWSEIDEQAIVSHNALFPELRELNYGDISNPDLWKRLPKFDLFFYSSSCQDISKSGKRAGFKKNSGTRSSLIWNCYDIIKARRPKYCILENVDNMAGKTFKRDLTEWKDRVDELGYNSVYKVLNAANYDIPQHRERVFMVSIRKDMNQKYYFPKPMKRTREINDFLEKKVDGKYYLSDEKVIEHLCNISSRVAPSSCDLQVPYPKMYSTSRIISQIATPTCGRQAKSHYEPPTIPTLMHSGGFSADSRNGYSTGDFPQPLVLEVWQSDTPVKMDYMSVIERQPYKYKNGIIERVSNSHKEEIINTMRDLRSGQYLRLRKMTPTEYLRFMGLNESEIRILENSDNSDKDLYEQAGNSIVVDVLFHVFRKLFIDLGFE